MKSFTFKKITNVIVSAICLNFVALILSESHEFPSFFWKYHRWNFFLWYIYIYIKFVIWHLVYEGHKRMQLPIGVLKKTALGNNIYWYQGLNRCAFICHYRLFFTSFQKWWDKSIHISRKCMHIPNSLQAF